MGWVVMSERELNRVEVLAQVDDGRLTVENAANMLDLTRRQIFRLLKRYRQDGAAAIRHRARGRPPNNRIHHAKRDYALSLIKENYPDFGPTLAAEMLAEHHGFKVSRETVRKWMQEEGLWLSRKQRRTFHQPRLRRECYGELIQIDGSDHRWFEDRGPACKRHKSTIFREIKRNFWSDDAFSKKYAGYFGHAAQLRTDQRRSVQRKLIRHPELCKTVVAKIKLGWTPEQIGNRMIYVGLSLRVCQETIYRYIYSKEGMDQELWWYLPEHRKARRPRRARKRQKPKFDRDVSNLFRPDDVAHRRQLGHWEGDLMLFKQKLGQSNATQLVKRVSRFTVLLKNRNKSTKPAMGKS